MKICPPILSRLFSGVVLLCLMMIPLAKAETSAHHFLYLPTQGGSTLLGVVDDDGQLLVPPIYRAILKRVGGDGFPMAVQAMDGRWGYIDRSGKLLVEPTLQQAKTFTEDGIARYQKDDKWGFVRVDGSYLTPPMYADVGYFSHGLAAVKEGKAWHYIDINGQQAFAATFAAAHGFNALGVAAAAKKSEGKLGLINRQGKWVVKPSYDEVRRFSQSGAAGARKGQRWGIVDSSGSWIVKPQYYQFGYFDESGIAELRIEFGRGGVISDEGEMLFDLGDTKAYAMEYSSKCGVLHHQFEGPVVFHSLANGEPIDELNKSKYQLASEVDQQCRMFVLHTGTDGWSRMQTDGTRHDLDKQVLEPYFNESSQPATFVYVTGKYVPVVLRDRSLGYVDYDGELALRTETLKQSSHDVIIMRDASGKELWRQQYDADTLIATNDHPAFFNKGHKDVNYTPATEQGLREQVDWLKSQEPSLLENANKYFNSNSEETFGAGVQLAFVDYGTSEIYRNALEYPTFKSEFDETKSVLNALYGPTQPDNKIIDQTLEFHDLYYSEWDTLAWLVDDKVLVLEKTIFDDDYYGLKAVLNLLLLPTPNGISANMSLPIIPISSVTLASDTDVDVAAAIDEVEGFVNADYGVQSYESIMAAMALLQAGKKVSAFDYIRLQAFLLHAAEPDDDLYLIGTESEYIELSKLLLETIENNGLGEGLLTSQGQFLAQTYVQLASLTAWILAETNPSEALRIIDPPPPYVTHMDTHFTDTYVRLLLENGQQEKAFKALKALFIENPWHEYLIDLYDDSDYQKWAKKNDAPTLSDDEFLDTASSVLEQQTVAVHRASGRLAIAWFNEIVMVDLATGKTLFTVDTETYEPFVFRFNHDGSKLIASGWDSTSVWNTTNGKRLAQQPTKDDNAGLAGVSANGKYYYYNTETLFGSNRLRFNHMGTDRLKTITANTGYGNNSSDDQYLAVGVDEGDEPGLKIIDLNKMKVVAKLRGEKADQYGNQLYFVNDNKRLLVQDYSDFHLWDIAKEKPLTSWDTGDFSVGELAVSNELLLIVDKYDFTKRSWNFTDKPQEEVALAIPEYARGGISALAISENNKHYALVTYNKDQTLTYMFVFDALSDEIINQRVSRNLFMGATFVNNDQHLLLEGYPIEVVEATNSNPVYEVSRH